VCERERERERESERGEREGINAKNIEIEGLLCLKVIFSLSQMNSNGFIPLPVFCVR